MLVSKKYFLVAAIFLLLSGCKLDFTANIDLGDLNSVALSQREGLSSSGTIKFEVGSMANCGEDNAFFTSILEQHFLDFKILPCEQVGMETYFVAGIKIPILYSHIDWPERTHSLIALQAYPSRKIGGVDVELLLNQARFRRINKAVEKKYFQKFELSRIAINLKNDQVSYQDVLVSDVFVNDQPVVELKAFGLSPGKGLQVELSDVKQEFFSLHNRVKMFSLILSI
ncbi:MAG: hypothetical protein VW455_14025 [Nitrospinota bacterium]